MGFTESIKTCLSKYATFSGRATRSEFWWFYLFTAILAVAATVLDDVLGTQFDFGYDPNTGMPYNTMEYGKVYALSALLTFLPMCSVLVRRLHDIGKSGWNYWWVLTGIGAFFLLYWLCKGGEADNAYGASVAGTTKAADVSGMTDRFAEIERLGTMLERGLITSEEFAEQKKRLLS